MNRHESAAEFQLREARLTAWNGPREEWQSRGPADIAYTIEALGVAPCEFAEILNLAHQATPRHVPAGLVFHGYRYGVAWADRTSGELLGAYRGLAIVAWTVTAGVSPRRPDPA